MLGPATGRVLSLSHGSILVARPEHGAAAAAGYDACGLGLDPGDVSPEDARRWRAMAEDLGVGFLELEVVRLGAIAQDRDSHRRLVEPAAMLGSRFLVTVGHHATELAMVEDLEWLRTIAEDPVGGGGAIGPIGQMNATRRTGAPPPRTCPRGARPRERVPQAHPRVRTDRDDS